MARPASRRQQLLACWPLETSLVTWTFGGDATVLADYELTMTKSVQCPVDSWDGWTHIETWQNCSISVNCQHLAQSTSEHDDSISDVALTHAAMSLIITITVIIIATTMFTVLSPWHCHRQSSLGSFDDCSTSAEWPPTFGPSQSAAASDPPELTAVVLVTIAVYHYSTRKLILMEGRRLSWPSWLASYREGVPSHRQSPIQVLTRPAEE